MVLPLLVISLLGLGIERGLCSVKQIPQLGFILVYNTTICVTLQVLYQHFERREYGLRNRTLGFA
jgi:hypothetical protein